MSNCYKHILIIDDNDKIRALVSEFLQKNDFIVSFASNPIDARSVMELFNFDLAVVDVMMPDEDGITFVKKLRLNKNNIPVLMLTALGETEHRISGFEAGVDDYLPKPFDPQELLLRINSILRRTVNYNDNSSVFKFGNFMYNIDRHELKYSDILIDLTESEVELLEYFISNQKQQLSREIIAKSLKLSNNIRNIDVLVTRLRKKIERDNDRFILTVRNVGYRFIP